MTSCYQATIEMITIKEFVQLQEMLENFSFDMASLADLEN